MRDRRTGKELTLKDVDGTIPGRAVLIIVNLNDLNGPTNIMRQDFAEGEYDCTDPVGSCHRLWESTKDDWPDHVHTVVANSRANYLHWRRMMTAVLGLTRYIGPEDFLKVKLLDAEF